MSTRWQTCRLFFPPHLKQPKHAEFALGFSKKVENLNAATALYVAHYDYCRWHGSINKTPAMAAGLTGHPWTMEELLMTAGVL